jgi:hypothetical protein
MIRSIEVEYNLNGRSFISGHGVGHSDNHSKMGTDVVQFLALILFKNKVSLLIDTVS